MIIDRIANAHLYYTVHARFQQAFDHIHQMDVNAIPVGRYEIDDEKMFALVQGYNTKLKDQGFWEAHRRYIDLQYIVQGAEGLGYANITRLQQGEYDTTRDFLPLYGDGDSVTLPSGSFVLLMPEDAHMPGMALGSPAPVRKIVVKIAVD
jgi:YhcH/YjgK/YiaL family protein